jgi:hypothetical protein
MQAATEWQVGSVMALRSDQVLQEEKHEEIEGHNIHIFEQRESKEAPKAEMENSIYSVLFENELQDFIMNPPPA